MLTTVRALALSYHRAASRDALREDLNPIGPVEEAPDCRAEWLWSGRVLVRTLLPMEV